MTASVGFTIGNVRLVFPGEGIRTGSLRVQEGKIVSLQTGDGASGGPVVDGGGRLLTPGLIDVHTHGIRTHQYEDGPEAIAEASRALPAFGTTAVFATVVPRDIGSFLNKLDSLSRHGRAGGARLWGFHVEGPFVALAGAACAVLPGDLKLLDEIEAACNGLLKIMSISPDQANILPVIERLVERGVVPFITHTRATPEQTEAAIEAGARHATHFYDVFPLPAETDPGVRPVGAVEAVLADPRCTVDFIADGVHVHPTAIRCALAAKGWQGVVLITDSNVGAGMPPGEYDTPWGYKVRIGPRGGARIADPKHPLHGALAGSALTMNVGIQNLLRWLPIPPEQVWAMGTLNPARLAGLPGLGRLAAGAEADLVLWDDDFQPWKTWVGGKLVYERDS